MRKEREDPEILLKKLEAKERSARMRCIMFYVPSVVLALILVLYIWQSFVREEKLSEKVNQLLNSLNLAQSLNLVQEPAEYPVYCILEAYNADGREVMLDLFIINLTGITYDQEDLEILAERLLPAKGLEISPKIQLKTKTGFSGEIIRVDQDEEFNEGKGEVDTNQIDEKHWEISVKRIEGKGILRLKIITTVEQPAISRNAKALVPLYVSYPGR